MRQVAWLHAAPKARDGKAGDKTRLEAMRERDETPLFPANPARYLTDWLFDVGPSCSGSMGEAAVSYQDLVAWQACNGVELLPWEAGLLRRLSSEYMAERRNAEEPARPAPYAGEVDDLVAKRAHVSRLVRSTFRNLKRKEG